MFGDAGVTHWPARVRDVHDVTGRGDSVLATQAWRLAEGDIAVQAMRRAGIAAGGLAVQTFGAALLARKRLEEAYDARR